MAEWNCRGNCGGIQWVRDSHMMSGDRTSWENHMAFQILTTRRGKTLLSGQGRGDLTCELSPRPVNNVPWTPAES